MNRNLHTQNKLTEFSREFEEEPETLFSKLVNKVSSAYNSNYNTINIIPPTSIPSINELTGGEASSSSSSHLGQPSVETKINTTSPSVSDNTSIDDKSDDSNNIGGSEDSKSSNNVFQMIGNLIPLKNNVSFYNLSVLRQSFAVIHRRFISCSQITHIPHIPHIPHTSLKKTEKLYQFNFEQTAVGRNFYFPAVQLIPNKISNFVQKFQV